MHDPTTKLARRLIAEHRQCAPRSEFRAGSTTTSTPVPNTSMPLLVGRRNAQDGRNFAVDGRLDDVSIWNRALSDTEVATVYSGGQGYDLAQITSTALTASRNRPQVNQSMRSRVER